MAITIVQSAHGNCSAAASISATWANPTTSGNTLFAVFAFQSTGQTVTPPTTGNSNWTGAAQITGSPWVNGANCTLIAFILGNAPVQSGAQTFTNTAATGGLVILEVSGLGTSPTLDSVSAGNNPTTVDTGSSTAAATNAMTPTGTTDLLLGLFAAGGSGSTNVVYSGPTNTFAILAQDGAGRSSVPVGHGDVAVLDLINSSGSQSTGATIAPTGPWIGVLVAYAPQAATTTTTTTTTTTSTTTTLGPHDWTKACCMGTVNGIDQGIA